MLIEIAVFSIEAALLAQQSGADRVELCCGPFEGGLTPGYGTILMAASQLTIPLNVMIRPREGDFCYSDKEFETMLFDIDLCKQTGVHGIVTGVLLKDGSIDTERVKKIVERSYPLSITFHRAFDLARNPYIAMEELIECGVHTILTSGGMKTAMEGSGLIAELIIQAGNRICVMPGSGINSENIQELVNRTNAKEIHLSAKTIVQGRMEFRKENIPMGVMVQTTEYDMIMPDSSIIRNIKERLKLL
jgi:copper homeostasis protein